jgi:hypothetical protein
MTARTKVHRSRAAVEVATDFPADPVDVAEAIGGRFLAFYRDDATPPGRSNAHENALALAVLAVGIRGWDPGRSLGPLPGGGARLTDQLSLDAWLPILLPLHLRVAEWAFRLRHARIRRRLAARAPR